MSKVQPKTTTTESQHPSILKTNEVTDFLRNCQMLEFHDILAKEYNVNDMDTLKAAVAADISPDHIPKPKINTLRTRVLESMGYKIPEPPTLTTTTLHSNKSMKTASSSSTTTTTTTSEKKGSNINPFDIPEEDFVLDEDYVQILLEKDSPGSNINSNEKQRDYQSYWEKLFTEKPVWKEIFDGAGVGMDMLNNKKETLLLIKYMSKVRIEKVGVKVIIVDLKRVLGAWAHAITMIKFWSLFKDDEEEESDVQDGKNGVKPLKQEPVDQEGNDDNSDDDEEEQDSDGNNVDDDTEEEDSDNDDNDNDDADLPALVDS